MGQRTFSYANDIHNYRRRLARVITSFLTNRTIDNFVDGAANFQQFEWLAARGKNWHNRERE